MTTEEWNADPRRPDVGAAGLDPRRPFRKSLRNPNINYRNGWFFVTTQVAHNKCVFDAIVDDRMVLNALGEAVRSCWLALPAKYPEAELDEFVVMPNEYVLRHASEVWVGDISPGGLLDTLLKPSSLV